MSDELFQLLLALRQRTPVDRRSRVYEQAGVVGFRVNDHLTDAGRRALEAIDAGSPGATGRLQS